MHYTVDYNVLEGDAKRQAALEDVKEFIDDEHKYAEIVEYIKACATLPQAEFGLGMAVGIEGYPVKALFEEYHKEL